jgi:hypothetical protein
VVRATLDLGAIMAAYDEPRGYPPCHPAAPALRPAEPDRGMVALLLYAYTRGIYASRRIAKACEERLDVMALTAMARPDFRTISAFRKRHLAALAGLFLQVLALCRQAGLVQLGHVALDRTKIKANASKHKAMSYRRMAAAEAALEAEIGAWLAQAEAADAAEDTEYGAERRGDETPDWVHHKQRRLAKIRAAKAALETEAQAAAAAEAAAPERYRGGRKAKRPPGQPRATAQRNFTDPESRIMKAEDGFVQACNAQAAVDAHGQIAVACTLTNNAADQAELGPLLDAIAAGLGGSPKEISADVGYCSEANLETLAARGIRGYVATGRQKHPATGAAQRRGPRVDAMRTRLGRAGRRTRYRRRKQTVEPVIGPIKQARGFRQFLRRGLAKVSAEWALICTAPNLTKPVRVTG